MYWTPLYANTSPPTDELNIGTQNVQTYNRRTQKSKKMTPPKNRG